MWEKYLKIAKNDNQYIQFVYIQDSKKIKLNLFETSKQELIEIYETLTLTEADIFLSSEQLIKKVFDLINNENWITVKYMFLYFSTLLNYKKQSFCLKSTFRNEI